MKPKDFIKENHNIVQAVVEMHDDHEIQMAREQCYTAASNAIELHRLLKQITERQGLEGWVQEKITLASDYLRQVKDWMEHDMMTKAGDAPLSLQPMGETVSAGGTSSGSVTVSTATPYRKVLRKTGESSTTPPQPPRTVNPNVPAATRKKYGGPDWKLTTKDIANEPERKNLISHPDVLRRRVGPQA